MSLWGVLRTLCAGVGRLFLVALSLAFADSSVRLILSDPCAGTARKVAGALAVALGLLGAASAAGVCARRRRHSRSCAQPTQGAHIDADTEAVEPINRARSRLLEGLAPAPPPPPFVQEFVQLVAVSPSADQASIELFDQPDEILLAPPPLPWHLDVDRLEDASTPLAFPFVSDSPLPDESPEPAVASYNEAIGLVHGVEDANEPDEDDENELEALEEMSEEDDSPALVVLHAGEDAPVGLGFVSDEELQELKYAEIGEPSSESPVPADLAPMHDVEPFVLENAEADQSDEPFDDAMPSGMSLTEKVWDEHKEDDNNESSDQHARVDEFLVIDLCHSSPEAAAAHASERVTTRRTKRPRAISRSLLLKRAMRQHALQTIKACGGNIVPRIRHLPHDDGDQHDDGKKGAKAAAHASANSSKRRSSLSSGSGDPSSAAIFKHFIDLRPREQVLQSMEERNRKLVERLLQHDDEDDEEDGDDESEQDDDAEQKAITSPRSAPVRRTRASLNNNNDDGDGDEEDERPAKRQRRFSLATASSHPYHTRAKDEERKESSEEDDDSDSNLSGSSNDAEKGGSASNGAALRGIWRLLC
jgi:hypothetical protein